MPLKHFGIFLAYGPTVDLRKEGLGRLLGAFLSAAAARKDVRFVIACPRWMKDNLLAFCESEGIPAGAFDIACTEGLPFVLRLHLANQARKALPPQAGFFAKLSAWVQRKGAQRRRAMERKLIAARNGASWFAIFAYAGSVAFLLSIPGAIVWLALAVSRPIRKIARKLWSIVSTAATSVFGIFQEADEEPLEIRFYRVMEELEIQRMRKIIDTLPHVKAWFCPTSFWPAFNKIAAPGLLCVPDVLPTEFPAGFADETELLRNFGIVERSIRGASHYVTYSDRVKWETLVDRYAVNPEQIAVVRHACWDLSRWIEIRGFPDQRRATRLHCERLLQGAFQRIGSDFYLRDLQVDSLRFLFYPSQFRPNKNVLTLLRSYEYLLRRRFIDHKLILTGDPNRYPAVAEFVREQSLAKDVLFLHGLSTPELAASYHLADLAVNPSLSEGGCPFTFTEAVSVHTPVVMSRIAVTEEVLQDPRLQEMMLFDPYDDRDVASKIEWALGNREALLAVQEKTYEQLKQRTWRDVVDEYVSILDKLAA